MPLGVDTSYASFSDSSSTSTNTSTAANANYNYDYNYISETIRSSSFPSPPLMLHPRYLNPAYFSTELDSSASNVVNALPNHPRFISSNALCLPGESCQFIHSWPTSRSSPRIPSSSYRNDDAVEEMCLPRPRWCPRREQVEVLESLFRAGTTTPSRKLIAEITTRLKKFGHVGEANVFYWFQNRKARAKRKARAQHNNNSSNIIISNNNDSNNNNNNNPKTKNSVEGGAAGLQVDTMKPTEVGIVNNVIPSISSSNVQENVEEQQSGSAGFYSAVMGRIIQDHVWQQDFSHSDLILDAEMSQQPTCITTSDNISQVGAPAEEFQLWDDDLLAALISS